MLDNRKRYAPESNLTDLIFGLALSIGAISLVLRLPRTPGGIFFDIGQFGFSFLILISVWLSYTKPKLEKLLTNTNLPEEAFTPRHDRFAMNLIRMPEDKTFSVIGGVWNPGQTTPVHDHLTWALIGVYKGAERESLFRRLDNGSNPKYAKLEMASEMVNKPAHVTVLGSTRIHRVDNISKTPAWSIHVYGRDIGNAERHSYDPLTGEVGRFVSGYCNVLRDLDEY